MYKKIKIGIPLDLDFTQKKQGFGALLIGIVVTLILGTLASIFTWGTAWVWLVLAMGVIVGILNIFHEEGVLFIMTLLILTIMFNLLAATVIFPIWAVTIFQAVVYLLVPTTVMIGMKVLYALAVK